MKINIISQDEQDNGVVYNAKGDIKFADLDGGAFEYSMFEAETGGEDMEVTFGSDGTISFSGPSGPSYFALGTDINGNAAALPSTWVDTDGGNPLWDGGSIYTLAWQISSISGDLTSANITPPFTGSATNGSQTLATDFVFNITNPDNANDTEFVLWTVTITNDQRTGAGDPLESLTFTLRFNCTHDALP